MLLSSGDNESPPVVVFQAAADKSNVPAAEPTMLWEEDDSQRVFVQNMSDRDLAVKISRLKNISETLKLKDDGEKLQANLRMHQAEADRRKLVKDDNKFENVTPLADKSICIDVTDGFESRGSPPSVSASQSEIASRSCSMLDKKRPTMSLTKESSTLQRCDHKRKSMPLSPRSQKIFSSSRQKIKDIAPRFQPMRNSKRNNQRTFVLVDEEDELEVDEENQACLVSQSSRETKIYYPTRDDPEVVVISYSDMEYLAPESYLSSTIMNFYIQYLQSPTSPRTKKRWDYHFFNTYFYNKLKQDVSNESNRATSFVKFRRWWKSVNIFEKAYIFIPIHEDLHWSLIIICIPNKADESGPIILHMDSLGLHFSKSILSDVKSFLIEEWKFLRQENVMLELPIPDNIWDKLSRRIDEKVIEVPQQKNDYDCGLFVLFFMERFLEEAPERLKKEDLDMFGKQWFRPEEASGLRVRISNLLKEEFKNADGGICK